MRSGSQHKSRDEYNGCFAKNLTYKICKKVGHLARICQSKGSRPCRAINQVETNDTTPTEQEQLVQMSTVWSN